MIQQNYVNTSVDVLSQVVPEEKLGLNDQEMNWKKAREVMAEQAKKIKALEQELSKSDDQKVAKKKALETLVSLFDSPNQSLRIEAAKLVLMYT